MASQQGSVTLIINIGGANNSQGGSGAEVNSLTLPITPEDIQISRPSRQAVTQTLTGAYQDHLGSGIATVSMRGHTGWRNLTPEGDGYNVIKRLRDLLGQYDKIVATDRPDRVSLMLLLSLPSGWEHFRVSKTVASYSRSRAQPLLYRYEIQFVVLHDFNDATGQVDPSPNFVINQGIYPNVVLNTVPTTPLPDSTTTPPDNSNVSTIVHHQVDTPPGTEDTPPTATTPPEPITLAQFTDAQYPPALGYPPGMFYYIVVANPGQFVDVFDPTTRYLTPGFTLTVPLISPEDAIRFTYNGWVALGDLYYSPNYGTVTVAGGGVLTVYQTTHVRIAETYATWDPSDSGDDPPRRPGMPY